MKNKRTCALCYEDVTTGTAGWTIILHDELDEWKRNHPTFAPRMMFLKNNDVLALDDHLKQNFHNWCGHYGLSPDSLDKTYMSAKGHTIKIIGIATANRKYPVIINDMTDGKRYKVSKTYAKQLTET